MRANPRTADVMRALGYVERHGIGIGIDNMIRAMEEAHLPRPELKDAPTSFTVTLRLHAFLDEDAHAWLEHSSWITARSGRPRV